MTAHPLPTARRRRTLVGITAAVALGASCLGGASLTAASAAPTEDCAETVPAADAAAGDTLHGLTVTSGTAPEDFTAKVIGTLTDGVAPGVPMIIVKVDPTTLDVDATEVKGIWEGMSGSPLYTDATHEHLLGAVAYGLATEQSWVAGVTPYEAMSGYLGTASADRSRPQRLSARLSRTVASAAGVTASSATSGFRALPTPTGIVGVSPAVLAAAAKKAGRQSWLASGQAPMGRMRPLDAGDPADTIVAGGNLAASMSFGDIVMAGLGTATSVCDGDVIGFGHPMNLTGDATMTLHPADALYVQGDSTPFKVGNIGPAVGTVFGDHLTGITGTFGALPATTTVRSTLTYGSRSRTGTTYVSVRDVDDIATATLYENMVNQTTVLDGNVNGATLLTWTITGTTNGTPFTLTRTNKYVTTYGGIPSDVSYRVASLAAQVTGMPNVVVGSVTTTATATKGVTTLDLVRVEQKRGKTWSAISQRKPAMVRAGGKLVVRAVLRGSGHTSYVPFTFAVPRTAKGRLAGLLVAGGDAFSLNLGSSIASARKALASAVRGDAVLAEFGRIVDEPGGDDEDYRVAAGRRTTHQREPGVVAFTKRAVSAPAGSVIDDYRMPLVLVR